MCVSGIFRQGKIITKCHIRVAYYTRLSAMYWWEARFLCCYWMHILLLSGELDAATVDRMFSERCTSSGKEEDGETDEAAVLARVRWGRRSSSAAANSARAVANQVIRNYFTGKCSCTLSPLTFCTKIHVYTSIYPYYVATSQLQSGLSKSGACVFCLYCSLNWCHSWYKARRSQQQLTAILVLFSEIQECQNVPCLLVLFLVLVLLLILVLVLLHTFIPLRPR